MRRHQDEIRQCIFLTIAFAAGLDFFEAWSASGFRPSAIFVVREQTDIGRQHNFVDDAAALLLGLAANVDIFIDKDRIDGVGAAELLFERDSLMPGMTSTLARIS